MMLKKGMTYDEKRWKRLLPERKKHKWNWLDENEKDDEIITKISAATSKAYAYEVQKGNYEINDSEIIKANRGKNFASEELTIYNFINMFTQYNKCTYNKRTSKL